MLRAPWIFDGVTSPTSSGNYLSTFPNQFLLSRSIGSMLKQLGSRSHAKAYRVIHSNRPGSSQSPFQGWRLSSKRTPTVKFWKHLLLDITNKHHHHLHHLDPPISPSIAMSQSHNWQQYFPRRQSGPMTFFFQNGVYYIPQETQSIPMLEVQWFPSYLVSLFEPLFTRRVPAGDIS